ncbi:MAG: hypothetical protein PUA96_08650 [Bacteroidales bacterium]|nr:hypothetical protein [Bacteroidales bacterium]
MNVFNPEHDLCLANGDPNFVPPESALKFGKDCSGLTSWIENGDGIIPWGWDAVLKRRLLRRGIPDELLPTDAELGRIRELSHRRMAMKANDFIRAKLSERGFGSYLPASAPVIVEDISEVETTVERFGDAVAKAPWSGSGKGLRWLRPGELSDSDIGWCRNVISKQGSVIVERREHLRQDFAMLFRLSSCKVDYEGLSLFFNENGMYRGNVLASDRWILERLGQYIPEALILNVKELLLEFLEAEFAGRYSGYAGVDMFICDDGAGGSLLAPSVEINARMTMGLLARRLFDRHLDGDGCPGRGKSGSLPADGHFVMKVEYSPSYEGLMRRLEDAVSVLTPASPGSQYAVAVFPDL